MKSISIRTPLLLAAISSVLTVDIEEHDLGCYRRSRSEFGGYSESCYVAVHSSYTSDKLDHRRASSECQRRGRDYESRWTSRGYGSPSGQIQDRGRLIVIPDRETQVWFNVAMNSTPKYFIGVYWIGAEFSDRLDGTWMHGKEASTTVHISAP